jgi:[ribosomal protein S5]-alanine N-acetyltransferase
VTLLRGFRPADAPRLVELADNENVSKNLRDAFPCPYRLDDALRWIRYASSNRPETHFAIEVEGELAGGIGVTSASDIHRLGAEVGYWLGEPYWGRGLATRALVELTDWAFATLEVVRLWAGVFPSNPASARVLEKAGYVLEARLKRAVVKRGVVMDELIYARVR